MCRGGGWSRGDQRLLGQVEYSLRGDPPRCGRCDRQGCSRSPWESPKKWAEAATLPDMPTALNKAPILGWRGPPEFVSTQTQNVTLFGHKLLADVIREDEVTLR